jgi:hypothetical protein
MVVRIAGKRMYLWRTVDHEGEVLDILVQRWRDKRAALRLMRKLLRKQGFVPKLLTTDKLGSYGAAFRHLRPTCPHEQGCERTIGLRTLIKQCDEESVKCSALSQLDPRSASSVSMPPSTTHSIFNDTLSPDRRCGPSEPKRRRCGKMPSQQHEKPIRPSPTSVRDRYRDNADRPPLTDHIFSLAPGVGL